MPDFDPITWAENEAARLRQALANPAYHQQSGAGWVGARPQAQLAAGEAAGALEFLRRYAGPDSDLYRTSRDALESNITAWRYLENLAAALEHFATGRRAGMLTALPFEVAVRVEAATDLMEQWTSYSTTSRFIPRRRLCWPAQH